MDLRAVLASLAFFAVLGGGRLLFAKTSVCNRICGWKSEEDRFGLEFDIKLTPHAFADVPRHGHQFLARTTAVMDQRQSMR